MQVGNGQIEKQHRFNVTEYYRMAETGILPPDARVELLNGEIIDMSPIGFFHGGIVARLARLFSNLAEDRWLVWPQNSIRLDAHSEPQPDIALLKPSPDDYTGHPPSSGDVLLLIEVADSSVLYDREKKLPVYGRADIPEVWIVNLPERVIEVYREPHFTGYSSKQILRVGDKAIPLSFPDVCVDVGDLLKTS